MISKSLRFLASALLLATGGFASAQYGVNSDGCASPLSSYAYFVKIGDTASAQYIVSNHPQCFGSGVSGQATMSASSVALGYAVSNNLSSRFLSAGGPSQLAHNAKTGMAAGATADKWNAWSSVTGTNTEISYKNAGGNTTTNSNEILTAVVGSDYALSSSIVLGLSGSFDRGNGLGTTGSAQPQDMTTKGYLFAPYIGWQITKDLAFDASIGFGSGELDVAGGTKSESDRVFGGANLSYSRWFDNIQLLGKVGYLHAEEAYDDSRTNGVVNQFTKNTNKLDQFRIGGQVGLWKNGFMPYAGVSMAKENRSASNAFMAEDVVGKNSLLWTLGVNFFSLDSKITGGIAFNLEGGRTYSKNQSLMANINVRF